MYAEIDNQRKDSINQDKNHDSQYVFCDTSREIENLLFEWMQAVFG